MQASISWLTDPHRLCGQPAAGPFRPSLLPESAGAGIRRKLAGPVIGRAVALCLQQLPRTAAGKFLADGGGSVGVWQHPGPPATIELQGYGQRRYVNTQYPWDGHKEIHPAGN